MTRRAGLTLIELLVVLTILVALSGIALRSTIGLEEQARFEATQRTLEQARDAIVTRPVFQGGSIVVTGFVADMGRLPYAPPAPETADLRELWTGTGLVPFAQYPSNEDPAVVVPFGWRGPYLHLPVGADPAAPLKDGWGSALVPLSSIRSGPALNGDPIDGVRSLGGAEAPYAGEKDVEVPSAAYACTVAVNVVLTGSLPPSATGQRVFLRLFVPDPDPDLTDPSPLMLKPWRASAEEVHSFDSDTDLAQPFVPEQFVDAADAPVALTPGFRIVRAYFDSDGDGSLDPLVDEGSDPLAVVLVPGANAVTVTLVLP